jgi:ABC-2 type transport system ATP-binding protein
MHSGRIVALDTPERLRADLGRELVELRVNGDPAAALATLRAVGLAHDNSFTVGSSLTVPLNGHTSSEAIAAIHELGLAAAVSARRPTLDDVYLRLTGGRLAEAA